MKKQEYRFITKDDCYLFGRGVHYELYHKLGCHPFRKGFYFAVWAPHASKVSVVGDFNAWNPDADPCRMIADSGIWEAYLPAASVGDKYKFCINGSIFKTDPFAFSAELRPGTAGIIPAPNRRFSDDEWMRSRAQQDPRRIPVNIYECHLGSWQKREGFSDNGFYNYREYAQLLCPYLKKMNYTHVELLGIAEHPFDGSWGYQVTGYFAPTSRYGTPDDFRYFVNYLHRHGIGVILDWVPAHFPKDAHGLAAFDGQPLYENADPQRGEHPEWGTLIFDYAKNEVRNFLIASALYWLNEYHIDGLRVDAVASMLYLDYGRRDGEWTPNKNGGRENLDAVEFFRHLNSVVAGRNDGTMMIAEESTAWPMVTHPVEDGGLGFTFKWNMGWMHDFTEYLKLDPILRKGAHHMMTFAMTYATSENFILVLSHDEVVHLKCSMISKMPGYTKDKFANLKCAYAFQFGHPGKKLLFMGQEFAQWHEWDEKCSLSWNELDEDNGMHREVQRFVAALGRIYRSHPCLYQLDDMWDGFEWINADDADRSIFSWVRYDRNRERSLLFVVNFTPMERSDYMVGVPKPGKYRLLLDQDFHSGKIKTARRGECDGREYHLRLPLAPYGAAILEF